MAPDLAISKTKEGIKHLPISALPRAPTQIYSLNLQGVQRGIYLACGHEIYGSKYFRIS